MCIHTAAAAHGLGGLILLHMYDKTAAHTTVVAAVYESLMHSISEAQAWIQEFGRRMLCSRVQIIHFKLKSGNAQNNQADQATSNLPVNNFTTSNLPLSLHCRDKRCLHPDL
ncbi:hypothetical protein QVD17_41372 [Tagetes erecta]|uniref:Uncharacterized protein n=1 Tax=Tagetes erecta TaxID=13708 RepID=A0AAD8JKB8_TARER|nr:hypothetical protein QVD17_41372 [Tagetes erecta]